MIAARWLGAWMLVLFASASLLAPRRMLAAPADSSATVDPHAVQPERPTVATHAHTVAPGWLELEAGVEHDRFADRSLGESAVLTSKLGLASRVQLEWTASALRDPSDATRTTAFGDLAVALKWRLLDGAPLLGDFALQPAFKLPTGSPARGSGTGTTDGSLLLISSHVWGQVSLDLNAGMTERNGDGTSAAKQASLWAASLGLPLIGDVAWVTEFYGLPGTSGPSGAPPVAAVLFGPTWTPRPWLELDLGAIAPLFGPQPHALYAGAVWNVGRL